MQDFLKIFFSSSANLSSLREGMEAEAVEKMVECDLSPWESEGTLLLQCVGGAWRDRESLNTGERKKLDSNIKNKYKNRIK